MYTFIFAFFTISARNGPYGQHDVSFKCARSALDEPMTTFTIHLAMSKVNDNDYHLDDVGIVFSGESPKNSFIYGQNSPPRIALQIAPVSFKSNIDSKLRAI